MRAPIVALFFASGFAGLVYEVSWVRGFGNELGNTVYSASIVTAVFMAGLGLGGFVAGRWADRQRTPAKLVRAYAGAELLVALFGIALAILVPRLGGISASISTYTRGDNGWYALSLGSQALRFALAALLVAPASFLMGTTLTLLVRAMVQRDVGAAGLFIGLLYGANTAGAALGAWATDAWLVPRLGIADAQTIAAAVNVMVGAGALALTRRATPATDLAAPATNGAPEQHDAPSVDANGRRLVAAACLALALSGFAALGMEIVWFRFLTATLGAYRAVFSLVLTAVLGGICIGSLLGGACTRRWGRPLELFLGAQALFAVTALGLMGSFRPSTPGTAILIVVGLPSILMGFSFPLVNACTQDAVAFVGRRAGAVYLANTLGSVLGSLASGLVLASAVGSQTTFAVLAAIAALAPVPLVVVARPTPALKRAALLAIGPSVIAVAAFTALPDDYLVRRFVPALPARDRVLAAYEGPEGTIHVLDNRPESRILFTNGHPMSGTSLVSQRYMRAFAHVPLLMQDEPQRALVICFGVGSTLHATSLHPLTKIDLADLSRGVLSQAHMFEKNNHDVLLDPRLSVYVQDGRQHLRQMPPATYDLVTLEPPPIEFAGVAALYSKELYELARSRLTANGLMTQWLPAYAVPPETGLAMVRAFLEVFPNAVLLAGSGAELVLMGSAANELVLDPMRFETNLRARPKVAEDLARVRLGSTLEIAGMFVAGPDHLRAATADVAPVTDDHPVMEYTFGKPNELSPRLFGGTHGIATFCPRCSSIELLADYLHLTERLYATAQFRKNQRPFTLALDDHETAVVRASPYLVALLGGDPRVHFGRGYMLAQKGDLAGAERELATGLAILPTDADAHYNLAVLYAQSGRDAEALAEAQAAVEQSGGEHARARQMVDYFAQRKPPPAKR